MMWCCSIFWRRWVPDAKLRRRILVENPEKFYGFDPASRPKAN